MIKFPYKIHLTIPERIAKSDLNKRIMALRPSAYRIHELKFVQFEWEYKTKMHRDNFLSQIVESMKDQAVQNYEISIVD